MFPIKSNQRSPDAVHHCEDSVPPLVAVRLASGGETRGRGSEDGNNQGR